MKVKMLTLAAGPDGCWPIGSTVDCDPKRAKALVAGGFAQLVDKSEDASDGSQTDGGAAAGDNPRHARGGKKAPEPAAG